MALLAYVFFLTKIGQETTQLALRARIQTQLTRKRSHPSHYNVLDKLRLPSASPRGGGLGPLGLHPILRLLLLFDFVLWSRKVRFAHLPSSKYCILLFNFVYFGGGMFILLTFLNQRNTYLWYFYGERFALLTFLHQSTAYYYLTLVLWWRRANTNNKLHQYFVVGGHC